MRARRARFLVLLGGILAACVGLTVAACSNTDVIPIPLGDPYGDSGSGSPTTEGGKPKTDGGTNPDDLDSGGADCSAAPVLRTSANGGFFCPFLPRGLDASSTDCADDETCCNPGKDTTTGKNPASFCAATPRDSKGATDQGACSAQAAAHSTTWVAVGGTAWECADQNNCAAGQVCCMYNAADVVAPDKVNIGPNLNKAIPPACNAKQAFKYGGTHCTSACSPDNELQTCGTSDDCTPPKTCRPFEVFPGGRDLGYCN